MTTAYSSHHHKRNAGPILIVEDDPFLLRAETEKLKREGFSIFTATNGDEALQVMRATPPALVLLDIIMPGRDGFSVLAELRTDAKLSTIPVIVLSNLGQESDRQQATELGAIDYYIKAETPLSELVTIVHQQLAKQ